MFYALCSVCQLALKYISRAFYTSQRQALSMNNVVKMRVSLDYTRLSEKTSEITRILLTSMVM